MQDAPVQRSAIWLSFLSLERKLVLLVNEGMLPREIDMSEETKEELGVAFEEDQRKMLNNIFQGLL